MWIKFKTAEDKTICEVLAYVKLDGDNLYINHFGIKSTISNEKLLNDIYISLREDQKTFDVTIYQ